MMKTTRLMALSVASLAMLVATGCSSSKVNCSYMGLETPYGRPIAHVHTSNFGWHWFGGEPAIGDATMRKTFGDFVDEAKRLQGTRVNVDYANYQKYWIIGFPFTLILTPCSAEVDGVVLP